MYNNLLKNGKKSVDFDGQLMYGSAIISLCRLANLLPTFCSILIAHVEILNSSSQTLAAGGSPAVLLLSLIHIW